MRLVGSGKRLKRHMTRRGLTPETLAEQAQTSRATIYRLIGGYQQHCNGNVGERIEKALGLRAESLFREAKRPRRPNGVAANGIAA